MSTEGNIPQWLRHLPDLNPLEHTFQLLWTNLKATFRNAKRAATEGGYSGSLAKHLPAGSSGFGDVYALQFQAITVWNFLSIKKDGYI